MLEVLSGVAAGVLQVVSVAILVGPLAWWDAHRRGERLLDRRAVGRLLLLAAVYIAAAGIYALPRVGIFGELHWNWQNKLLVFAGLALLVSLLPRISWRDVGVRRPERGWWIPVVVIIAAGAGLQSLVGPVAQMSANLETVLFQAFVPGLDEELLYRGILLLALDRAMRVPTTEHSEEGRRIRWSVVVSCLLFGMAHGLTFTSGFDLRLDPASIVATGLLGALFIWIRTRWNSLIPALLAHNAWNSTIVVANALAG